MKPACAAALLACVQWAGSPAARAEQAEPVLAIEVDAPTTLAQVNAYRAQVALCGSHEMRPVAPLKWNAKLQAAAEVQARYLAERGGITHVGRDGSDVSLRATREGYRWRTVGENTAAGRHTVDKTLAQWMASPGHCSNVMNPAVRDVAVAGFSGGGEYGSYWVMVLGAQR